MGLSGISKSQVWQLCKDIDEWVSAFLDRPLDGEWPYLWLDATYLKVCDGGRIVSVAAIIAVAVTTAGRREIVDLGIGPSEAEPFWSSLLKGRTLRRRPDGVTSFSIVRLASDSGNAAALVFFLFDLLQNDLRPRALISSAVGGIRAPEHWTTGPPPAPVDAKALPQAHLTGARTTPVGWPSR